MSSDADAVACQIADRIEQRLVSPLASLVGLDLPDVLTPRVESASRLLAAQLYSDDDRLAAQVVIDVMTLLWPDTDPEDDDPTWWHTPLGRQVARSIGRDDTTAVTYQRAATMLGVERGTVSKWVQRGTLDRHPDGGVRLGSVLERLARST